jgi:hypothetical protein
MRFNKENVINNLWSRIERLEKEWLFNPDKGWSQVEGASFHKVMAYGEYDGLKSVIDAIEYKTL